MDDIEKIPLDEATFPQIVEILRRRYNCVVVAVQKEGDDGCSVSWRGNSMSALGMLEFLKREIMRSNPGELVEPDDLDT